jgi:REP element-mobilizing transposase RayT
MGRPLRFDHDGAWQHLINRGADRQDIFSVDDDRHVFEYQLGELDRRGLFETHAYVLMDNHFHLFGRSPHGEVSAAMHRLGSEYVRWYNREHHRDGPLFRNRFVSVLIEDDAQLMTAARYVHRNPLSIVPTRALAAYRWSSYGVYLGRRDAPPWLERSVLDDLMGTPDEHRAFVENWDPSDLDHDRWIAFRDGVDVDLLEGIISAMTGVGPDSFVGGGRRHGDAFVLLLLLALEHRVGSAEQLAHRYGLASPAAVRSTARRARVRLTTDPQFAALRSRVLDAVYGRRAA